MSKSVRATGFQSGGNAMKEIGNYIASHGMDAFFMQAAEKTSQAQKNLAPIRTGFLRNNIGYSVQNTQDGPRILFFSRARYSSHVEYGTYKMMARPYFFPPFYTVMVPELRRANEELRKKVNSEFRKAKGRP